MKKYTQTSRILCYILGMAILALGLTLTAETNLGTSPLTAIPLVISQKYPISFADATLIAFVLYAIAQMILLLDWKRVVPTLLQIPVSIFFTRIMGMIQSLIDIADHSIAVRFVFLLLGIVCTGVGAAMTLKMKILPIPPDGFVQVTAEKVGKPLGTIKNILDIPNVCGAVLLSFLLLSRLEGVGVGSILAMLGVGRVIAAYNKIMSCYQI